MQNKITFFVISTTGSPVRQASVSRSFLYFTALLATVCMVFLGFGVHNYNNLRQTSKNTIKLENTIAGQKKEINDRDKQLQAFRNDINGLKAQLVALNKFEQQVRIVAGLGSSKDQDSLFGVGGSMPEDLDSKRPLKEQHKSLIREMHDQVEQLGHATQSQEKGFESLLDHLEKQRSLLAATPSIHPAKGVITSKFGRRKSPFTGRVEFHKGYDIANKKGTPIVAPANGTVTFAGIKGFFGKMLVINHGHGIVTRYAHINKFRIKRGAKVKRGDVVATIGNTGRSTGPHVHYEVLLNGVQVNPAKYILD